MYRSCSRKRKLERLYGFNDIFDGFPLTELHGSLSGMASLMEATEKFLLAACAVASDDYNLDFYELYSRTLARFRIGSIEGDGVYSIIDSVTVIGKGSKKQIADRDMLGGALATPHPAKAFRNYLFKSVDNAAKNIAARVHRIRPVALDDVPEPAKDVLPPEDVEHREMVIDRLKNCIATLPDDQRTAIHQYFFGPKASQAIVAERLGMSRDRFQGLLNKAYDAIREAIPAEWIA